MTEAKIKAALEQVELLMLKQAETRTLMLRLKTALLFELELARHNARLEDVKQRLYSRDVKFPTWKIGMYRDLLFGAEMNDGRTIRFDKPLPVY